MKSVAIILTDREAEAVASDYALLSSDPGKAAQLKPTDPAKPVEGFASPYRSDKAAAFIQVNMPLGQPDTLSDQAVWDVAAFVNSHPRPQDPRENGDFEETVKRFHGGRFGYYGALKLPDAKRLGKP